MIFQKRPPNNFPNCATTSQARVFQKCIAHWGGGNMKSHTSTCKLCISNNPVTQLNYWLQRLMIPILIGTVISCI